MKYSKNENDFWENAIDKSMGFSKEKVIKRCREFNPNLAERSECFCCFTMDDCESCYGLGCEEGKECCCMLKEDDKRKEYFKGE